MKRKINTFINMPRRNTFIDDIADDTNPLVKMYHDVKKGEMQAAHWINDNLGINWTKKRKSSPTIHPSKTPTSKFAKISAKHRSISTGAHMATNSTVDEVPVVPIPRRIAKSYPDYFTVDLPFYWTYYVTLEDNTNLASISVRLNSPYDPILSATTARGGHQPLGRDTWASIYDYYRVVSSDTNITFTYQYGIFGSDEGTSPYAHFSNPTHALVGYHITDDTSTTPSTVEAFVEAKHTKAMPLHPRNTNIMGATTPSGAVPSLPIRIFKSDGTASCSFHYAPENWDYHVTGVGLEETWTAKDANPAFNHYMNITAAYPRNEASSGGFSSDDKIVIRMDVYQTFTTQWREIGNVLKNTMDTNQ